MTLNVLENSNIFVSGGIDGRINLWMIEPTEFSITISTLQEYTLTKDETQDAIKNPKSYI